jgi:hypothetical protein
MSTSSPTSSSGSDWTVLSLHLPADDRDTLVLILREKFGFSVTRQRSVITLARDDEASGVSVPSDPFSSTAAGSRPAPSPAPDPRP